MTGEIRLGRGDFEIAIATGRPPCQVAVSSWDLEETANRPDGMAFSDPVILEEPRLLEGGFAFRARVAVGLCRIVYQYS
jgi:hypothetical protein